MKACISLILWSILSEEARYQNKQIGVCGVSKYLVLFLREWLLLGGIWRENLAYKRLQTVEAV